MIHNLIGTTIRNVGRKVTGLRLLSSLPKQVNVEINENTGVALVTLNRLPVNSLNLELVTELSNVFDEILKNKSKGMIITSVSSVKINILIKNYVTQIFFIMFIVIKNGVLCWSGINGTA